MKVNQITLQDCSDEVFARYISTLAELCGLPAPPRLDGADFTRELRHRQQAGDTTISADFAFGIQEPRVMIRSGDYIYSHLINDMWKLRDLRGVRRRGRTQHCCHGAKARCRI